MRAKSNTVPDIQRTPGHQTAEEADSARVALSVTTTDAVCIREEGTLCGGAASSAAGRKRTALIHCTEILLRSVTSKASRVINAKQQARQTLRDHTARRDALPANIEIAKKSTANAIKRPNNTSQKVIVSVIAFSFVQRSFSPGH